MRLLALLPPENIRGEISKIKKNLFYSHGVVSFLALPPLVPLEWEPDFPDGPVPGVLPRFTLEPRLVRRQNGLFFPLLAEPDVPDWLFRSSGGGAVELFPCFPGVFAASAEECDAIPEVSGMGEISLSWQKSEVVLFEIDVPGEGPWWKAVFFRQIFL